MRRSFIASVAMVGLMLSPGLVAAEDSEVQAQLEAMQRQLDALSERLEATTDELEVSKTRANEQEQLIREAGLADPQGSSSSLGGFWDTIEFGGWLSASYWYNFNQVRNDDLVGANTGINGQSSPFNPDANQFSFDQLWFEMERPIDESNRAGFVASFAFGKVAKLLPDGNGSDGGNSLYIPEAYIQYLTPMGPTLKAGKFGTWIGYEVAQTVYNENISRSFVYNMLQPIDHVGISLEGDFGDSGAYWGVALVNNVFKTQPVVNDNLAYMGKIGYAEELWSIQLAGLWGQVTGDSCGSLSSLPTETCGEHGYATTGGDSNHKAGIIDVVATLDPTERLHFWVNGDYVWSDSQHEGGSGAMPAGWGVEVGGRYALTDRLGTSLRGEWVADDREYFGFVDDADLWSLTTTVDYALTEQLMVRGEVRYDNGRITKNPDHLFINDNTTPYDEDDQILVGAELVYKF
jgi:hypothetical protein